MFRRFVLRDRRRALERLAGSAFARAGRLVKAGRDDRIARLLSAIRRHQGEWAAEVQALRVPGMRHRVDPWLFAQILGNIASTAEPEELREMRQWPLSQWASRVDAEIDRRIQARGQERLGGGAGGAEVRVQLPPAPPPPPPSTSTAAAAPIPAPPEWLTGPDREAWIQARTRAGEYIRGLGNVVDGSMATIVREEWKGVDVVREGLREQRLDIRETVRELTAEAIANGRTVEDLASDLGHATGDWSRNWERIARTELQNAHNEGHIIDAIRNFGGDVGIAKVPNAGACRDCRRLYLDANGRPRIFPVRELLANGTNAGRPRAQWLATLHAIHPRCECTPQTVPPGLVYNDAWRLVPAGEDADAA